MKPGVGGLGTDFITSPTFHRSGVVPTWREPRCPSLGLLLLPSSVDEEPEAQRGNALLHFRVWRWTAWHEPEALIPESLSEGRISRIDV